MSSSGNAGAVPRDPLAKGLGAFSLALGLPQVLPARAVGLGA
jgi:hypothetical protein